MGSSHSSTAKKEIILYRGTNCTAEFDAITAQQTAGGWPAGTSSNSLPTSEQVEHQKGTSGECAPIPKDKAIDITKFTPWVEYTRDIAIARQFNRGGVVQISVAEAYVYIVEGDQLESGVFLHRSTPVDIEGTEPPK
ncbi:hypothetical protein [Pseudoalteromonas rubra]|uniref:Uncharacterized protein n=1 Tax=Pseudoalteromonas rubra TaxID=43658 RepID=A0A0U2ZDM7_9GAMM|nr:hypothetical protein [Pseudoalteromonas rubra]ALU45921.1 hypothetical protein AT705_23640 [Pseudoalteromonas rubra]